MHFADVVQLPQFWGCFCHVMSNTSRDDQAEAALDMQRCFRCSEPLHRIFSETCTLTGYTTLLQETIQSQLPAPLQLKLQADIQASMADAAAENLTDVIETLQDIERLWQANQGQPGDVMEHAVASLLIDFENLVVVYGKTQNMTKLNRQLHDVLTILVSRGFNQVELSLPGMSKSFRRRLSRAIGSEISHPDNNVISSRRGTSKRKVFGS